MASSPAKASRAYTKRFAIAMTSYVVLLFVGIYIAQALGDSPWRFVAMALPLPAIIAVVWAVSRYVAEADEMQSNDLVRSLAVAFGAGSAITFSYGIMQVIGAPQLNWMFVWVVYSLCWMVASFWVRRGRQ